jgi:hypothetical protein
MCCELVVLNSLWSLCLSLWYLAPDVDVSCYVRQVEDVKFINELCDVNDQILICGDYNLSEVNWMYDEEDGCMISLDLRREKSVVLLEDLAFCDLNQMNGISNQPERFLDLIFSNVSSSDLSVRSCECPMVRLDRHHRPYEISYSVESYEFLAVPQQERVFDF